MHATAVVDALRWGVAKHCQWRVICWRYQRRPCTVQMRTATESISYESSFVLTTSFSTRCGDELNNIALCVQASYLRFWTFKVTFYAQWKAIILMALTMLAEVEFRFFLLNDDQLCLITLRVRSSYLRVWAFEATFYAQWKARILMASMTLAKVELSFVCCSMMAGCALSLCECGRHIWYSELLRRLFMISEKRES